MPPASSSRQLPQVYFPTTPLPSFQNFWRRSREIWPARTEARPAPDVCSQETVNDQGMNPVEDIRTDGDSHPQFLSSEGLGIRSASMGRVGMHAGAREPFANRNPSSTGNSDTTSTAGVDDPFADPVSASRSDGRDGSTTTIAGTSNTRPSSGRTCDDLYRPSVHDRWSDGRVITRSRSEQSLHARNWTSERAIEQRDVVVGTVARPRSEQDPKPQHHGGFTNPPRPISFNIGSRQLKPWRTPQQEGEHLQNQSWLSLSETADIELQTVHAEKPSADASLFRHDRAPAAMPYPTTGRNFGYQRDIADVEGAAFASTRVRSRRPEPLGGGSDGRTSALTYSADPLPPPPDGGWLAWAHAGFGSLVIFSCWGLNLAFGVFEAYYKEIFIPSHSHAVISLIGSVQLFFVFFTSLVVGRCYDLGYARRCFHAGSVALFCTVLATSWCQTWTQLFWVQGVLTGISMGTVFCSGVLVVGEYFTRNLGLAMAVGAAGSSLGGIVYTAMARALLLSDGFGPTIRYMSIVVGISLIPGNVVFRPRRTRAFWRARAAIMNEESAIDNRSAIDWSFMKDSAFISLTLGMFFAFAGVYFGFYYIVSFAYNVRKMTASQATDLLILMLVANLPGRLLPAFLSDRCIGPVNTLIPACFLTAMVTFLWISTNTSAGLYILACFYGFASAGIQALFSPAISAFSQLDDPSRGVKSAVVFVTIGLACLIGSPLGGLLVDTGGIEGFEYIWAQIFAGTALTLSGICFLACRVLRVGWDASRI